MFKKGQYLTINTFTVEGPEREQTLKGADINKGHEKG